MSFEYDLTVLEAHLDTFGHVNNATYLELYEQARWDFITKGGYGLKEVQKRAEGPVILELNLKFKRELPNRSQIKILSKFAGFENRLVMKLSQEIRLEGKIASTLDLKVGLMDLEKRKLIEPTKDWLSAIGAS